MSAKDELVSYVEDPQQTERAKTDSLAFLDRLSAAEQKQLLDEIELPEASSSTPAPNAEPAKNIFADIGFYTVPDLTADERRPPEFFVDGMIPAGLSFLAGAPKTRKSYLALQMAAAIATGSDFLGRPTIQSDVVYFDLEGSKSRSATRAEQMPQGVPRNVYITNKLLHRLSDGLVEDIRLLHRQNPGIRVCIIDTYSRARGQFNSKGANAYDMDVSILEPLQRMATEERIAVICVHHFRKGASLSVDSFEAMSGTMGISGSADCVLNLVGVGKRFEGRATLEVTPRDARSCELELSFDDMTGIWMDISHETINPRKNPVCKWILDNAPERAAAGVFYTYREIAEKVIGYCTDNASGKVREAYLAFKEVLFRDYSVVAQLGVKSHGERGLRIFRV